MIESSGVKRDKRFLDLTVYSLTHSNIEDSILSITSSCDSTFLSHQRFQISIGREILHMSVEKESLWRRGQLLKSLIKDFGKGEAHCILLFNQVQRVFSTKSNMFGQKVIEVIDDQLSQYLDYTKHIWIPYQFLT